MVINYILFFNFLRSCFYTYTEDNLENYYWAFWLSTNKKNFISLDIFPSGDLTSQYIFTTVLDFHQHNRLLHFQISEKFSSQQWIFVNFHHINKFSYGAIFIKVMNFHQIDHSLRYRICRPFWLFQGPEIKPFWHFKAPEK